MLPADRVAVATMPEFPIATYPLLFHLGRMRLACVQRKQLALEQKSVWLMIVMVQVLPRLSPETQSSAIQRVALVH